MKEIVINPFTVEEEINIGYQFDHKATKIVFDGLEDNNYYLKLQDTQSYQAFPIPNNEFEITNTYTQKTLLTGQIYRKIDNELIAHGRVFKMSLKTSIPQSSKIKEVVPPAFKNEYDRMVDTTNEINRKLVAGEFNGKDGKDYEHSEEFERLSKEVKQNALASNNSASSALDSSNKAKEHLDNVIEKVNVFNVDYANKVNNFNSNVENANNTLDAKIEKANTDIDKKVLDANTNLDKKIADANSVMDGKVTVATEQAGKAKQEADRAVLATDGKLDKQQGAENAGKALVVGEDGIVVPGSALPDNVYTQEEVDYLLADKMDKPYVDITITDSVTIDDCLDGNFKISSIEGNTVQKIETDIVPTPSRPVPITSKKIKICVGENLFNIDDVITNNTLSVGNNSITITDNYGCNLGVKYVFDKDTDLYANYVVSNASSGYSNLLLHNASNTANNGTLYANRHVTVKAGEYVLFAYGLASGIRTYSDIAIYKTKVIELKSLKESVNLFDSVLCEFEVGLLNNNGILQPGFTTYFTSGYIPIKKSTQYMVGILGLDGYTLTGIFFYDQNYNLVAKTDSKPFTTPANSMYVKFGCTKNGGATDEINKHAMLVEGATVPSAYVAPTVRDYKIVDHVNKKAWIERNIQEVNLNNLNFVYNDTKTDYTRFYAPLNPTLKYTGEIYSNSFPSYKSYDYTKESIYGGNVSGGKTLSVIVKDSNVAEYTKEALLNYINNPNAVAYHALETPIVEEIPYVESDTSEFGISSQDTTSPSPSIKSNIESVKVLNIKACAKNLFDVSKANEFKDGVLTSANNTANKEYVRVKITDIFDYIYKTNKKMTISFDLKVDKPGYVKVYSLGKRHLDEVKVIQADNEYKRYSATFSLSIDSNETNGEDCQLSFYGTYGTGVIPYVKNLQIEVGDTVTSYEPYKETSINHELENPLLSIKDYRDRINLNARENLTLELPKEQLICDISVYKKMTNCIRFGLFNAEFKPHISKDTEAVLCDMFKTLKNAWSIDTECIFLHDADSATKHMYISVNKNRLTGYNDNLTDAEIINLFKEFINNNDIRIWWVLAEPTTEPLETELIKKLKQLKTYGPVTHVIITGKVKPTINGSYPKDILLAQQKLETKLLTLQTEVIKNV